MLQKNPKQPTDRFQAVLSYTVLICLKYSANLSEVINVTFSIFLYKWIAPFVIGIKGERFA